MSKILITSDLHFTSRDADAYRWEIFPILQNIIDEEEVAYLMILGDVTDNKDEHNAKLVNTVTTNLAEISKNCATVIIKGNHDYVDPTNPFFGFLSYIPNVKFITSPIRIKLNLGGRFLDVAFLPHSRNPMADWRGFVFEGVELILAHQTFNGAKASTGMELGGLPTDLFKKFGSPLVVSGDIHVPQVLGNIIYVGSPYPIRFGDTYEGRVLLFDADLDAEEYAVNIIRKATLAITPEQDLETELEKLDIEDQLKIVFQLPSNELARLTEYKAKAIEICERKGISLHSVGCAYSDSPEEVRKALAEMSPDSARDIFENFAMTEKLNKRKIKIGNKILSEVLDE